MNINKPFVPAFENDQNIQYLDLKMIQQKADSAKNKMGYEQVAVLLLINGKGRPRTHTSNLPDGFEYVMYYHKGETGKQIKGFESTIAHEILHLFGAMDLVYYDSKKTVEDQSNSNFVAAGKLFPTSIMGTGHVFDLWTLLIDPVNRYLIGWDETYDAKYERFFNQDG